MRLSIDLLKLVGAEPIEHNRIPGVFIPLVPNIHVEYGKRGMAAYLHLFVTALRKLKPYDYRGRIIVPDEHKDRYLESDKLIQRGKYVAWGWSDKHASSSGSLVSEEDFNNLVGD